MPLSNSNSEIENEIGKNQLDEIGKTRIIEENFVPHNLTNPNLFNAKTINDPTKPSEQSENSEFKEFTENENKSENPENSETIGKFEEDDTELNEKQGTTDKMLMKIFRNNCYEFCVKDQLSRV